MTKSLKVLNLLVALSALGAFGATSVRAATISDAVNVTVGGTNGGNSGYSAGQWGAVSPTTTTDGYVYQRISSQPERCNANHCTASSETLSVSGFTANPGQGWLTSLAVGSCTMQSSGAQGAAYTYASGLATWTWPNDYCDFALVGSIEPVAVVHAIGAGVSGWITPKYQVVGITYAPPGSRSSAVYTNGFLSGTASSNTSSFKVGTSVTATVSGGFSLFGVLSSNVTNTYSVGWEQLSSASNSISVAQQYSTGLSVPGPASSAAGVNHDYDTVYVWLNPAVFMTIYPTGAVAFGGYNWDARDTVTGMDVVPLTLGQLRGAQPITAALLARLNRTWDFNLGAILSTDLLAIANTDPFYNNPLFNPNTDSSHRFDLPNGNNLVFNYIPVPPGGQATGQTYSSTYSTTSMSGKSASSTYTVGYSVEGGASASFIASVSAKIKVSGTYAYTNQWSSNVSSGTTQAANFTIYPPLASDNYVGPTAMQVWKDNVYGTFMFFPQN